MSARSYLVGLPVLVTVDDDGSVTYEVDTAEAGQAIREDDQLTGVPESVIDADATMVDADHGRRFAAELLGPQEDS